MDSVGSLLQFLHRLGCAHALQRLLAPHRRRHGRKKAVTPLLMFAYSFLAMTGYNIVKPVTRSQFIDSARRRQPSLRAARRRA